jgi:hypothetical protein
LRIVFLAGVDPATMGEGGEARGDHRPLRLRQSPSVGCDD